MRRKIGERYHPRSEKYRKILRFLRQEAAKVKRQQRKKYWSKVKNLERKYREDEEEDEKLAPPAGMANLELSVFNRFKVRGYPRKHSRSSNYW